MSAGRTEDDYHWLSRRRLLTLAGVAGAGGVLASTYGGGRLDTGMGRDFPLQTMLPSAYRPGRDDIGPYIQDAMALLEPSGTASLLLPPGRHRWDSPCYFAADTADLTYELRGYGRGTIVELGPGLRGQFAVHLNETENGDRVVAFPRHPRLRVLDMHVTASDSSIEASLCYFSQASVDVQRVRFTYLKYGVTGSGYTDLMSLRHISWEQPADDGRLYLQQGTGGDGLVIEQVTASLDAVVAELIGCVGATISSCIGGRFIFTDCDGIEVVAPHCDTHGGDRTATEPFVIAQNSRVAFRGGWNHVGSQSAAFVIDDSVRNRYSEVTWDGYSFAFRADEPDKERAPDIRIVAAQDATKVRFRGCSSRLQPRGDRNRWAVGPKLASDDSGVQAAIDADPTAPLEDTELVRDESGWAFRPSGRLRGSVQEPLANPMIESASSTDLFPGDHSPGVTYHYTLAAFGSFARGAAHSRQAAEASTTVTEGGNAIALRVTLGGPRAAIRVWRGRSSGAYDSYADLAVGAYSTMLVDTGPFLCGSAWIAADVPDPPAENNS